VLAGDARRAAAVTRDAVPAPDSPTAAYALALAALVEGDDARAATLLSEAVATSRGTGAQRALAYALTDLGGVACRQGDGDRAAALLAEGLALHRALGNQPGLADALIAAGVAVGRRGDHDGAEVLLREAAAVCQGLGDPERARRCLAGLAEVAAAHGHYARAARLLGAALAPRDRPGPVLPPAERAAQERLAADVRAALGATATADGASPPPLAALAEALTPAGADAPGRGPARRHPAPPDGLTPREAAILRLIAAGRTNREIAGDLGVGVRTVESHVNNLYAKLHLRGRTEATAYAFRHGLAEPVAPE
jgi:DNA-binding CsgD family transcriptional regulator